MSISPRFKEELRNRITLSDLIGKRVQLRRAGREFSGCCPFHKEKTPSFTVNDDKQFYHCFGCGAHGDVIEFLMSHDNLSFIDAIEQLAAMAGMEVPKPSPQEVQKAKEEKDLYGLIEDTTKFFESVLLDREGGAALQYLQERGVPEDQLHAFRLGYSPADGQALRNYLKQKGYTDAQMIEAGVTRPSNRGTDPYAFFRDRIMFPVTDRRGRVVAFGGRILPEHLRPPERGDFKPPKYINSSDTPLFHKGRMLYNEAQARQAAADGQPVIVVEGYLDVMACSAAGYKGAVAPLGTALTEDQIVSLWKMIPAAPKTPILCFDGDNAGQRAAARACERLLPLLAPDQSVEIAFLPQGEDPDSLIEKKGRGAFQKILDSSMSLVDFLWEHHTAGRSLKTPEARAGLEKTLNDEVTRIAERSVQQYYRQAIKDKLYKAFGPSFSKKQGGKGAYNARNARQAQLSVRVGRPAVSRRRLLQHILLASLINHPVLFSLLEEALGMFFIENKRLDSLRQAVLNILGAEPGLDRAGLYDHLCEQGYVEDLAALMTPALYTHAGFARQDTDEDYVIECVQALLKELEQEDYREEYRAAAQSLAQDTSPENEERVMALHQAQGYADS